MTDIDREEELLEKEPTKKREDLIPEFVLTPDGEEVEAFAMGDAAVYMGMKRTALHLALKRLEKKGQPVTVYAKKYGGIERYLLKRDLDELRRVEPTK